VPTSGSASLQPLSPLSLESIEVQIVDTSKNGLGLLTPVFLQAGTIVHLRIEASNAIGTVTYCEKLGDNKHKTGVKYVKKVDGWTGSVTR
jgi:hypothetical protein